LFLEAKEAEENAKEAAAAAKEAKALKAAKDLKESRDAKDAKELRDAKAAKDNKDGKDGRDGRDGKDGKDGKDKKNSKRSKDSKEPAKQAEESEPPAKQARGISGLGDLAEMQKRLEDERNKLRLYVIKAKQEWEERQERLKASGGQEARGETDDQSYYIASVGEVFGPGGEYKAEGSIGKGVFSSVFRCKNTKQNTDYAIKFVRSNHMMRRAAEKEVELYRRLARQGPKEDPEGAQYLMFLAPPETFIHQGHLCMVFDLEKCDLRSALSKYGQGRGLPLQTVAQYSRQIFLALRVLRKMKVIHGDLKPDNLLMSQSKTEIKICDFGSAMDVADQVSTAYFQPRYYRAPEIMIGNVYDTQIDLWSAGVTLFELGTGRILFTGRSNNMMLRQMLEVCGPFPQRMATSGTHSSKHFKHSGDFLHKDPDSITGEPEVMPMKRFAKPSMPIQTMLERILKEPPPNADAATQQRLLPRMAELVSKCLRPDPAERFTPDQALVHHFFRK